MMDKPILDATCGGRMMWFDKENPRVLYVDNRELPEVKLCDDRTFSVAPDIVADFRNPPFPAKYFKLVVFDPPHLIRAGESSWSNIKYGRLPKDWKALLHDGFYECMRVLDDYGTLIFKWSEIQIPTREVIKAIGVQPLFGHTSGKRSNTHWMTFMKFPDEDGGMNHE